MTKELFQLTAYANTQAFPIDDTNCKDTIRIEPQQCWVRT